MGSVQLSKNQGVQVMRALLFMLVFFFHALGDLFRFNPKVVIFPMYVSGIGVTPFFVISGFLLMARQKMEEEKLSLKACLYSMIKSVARLYPLHILTTLVIFFIWAARYWHGGVLAERVKDNLLVPLFFHALLIQSWFSTDIVMKLNGPTWYLSTAAFLYFTFPVVKKLIQAFDGKKVFVLALAVLAFRFLLELVTRAAFAQHDFHEVFPLFRVADFWIGCIAGNFYRENKEKLSLSNFKSFALQIAAALVCVALSFIDLKKLSFWPCVFFASNNVNLVLSAIWVYFFVEGKGLIRFATFKPLVVIGNLSGAAYVIHGMVMAMQNLAHSFFNLKYEEWSLPALYGVALAEFIATLVLSILWIEFSKKIFNKRNAPASSGTVSESAPDQGPQR